MEKLSFKKTSGLPSLAFVLSLFGLVNAQATTRYVNANNPTAAWPYTTWDSAAASIQEAVDVAVAGDVVLVTNGVYSTGGGIVSGTLLSRVMVNKAITVRSVNGPAETLIVGNQVPGTIVGIGATRCVYLTNNATLIGFTLTNGATQVTGGTSERSGGGVYCRSMTAVVSNCVILGNAASASGGGAFQGLLLNCTLLANTATNGAGVASSVVKSSVLSSNQAFASGGGAYNSSLTNCTLTANSARACGGGAFSGTLTNCTIAQNAAGSGGGIYTATALNCILRENAAITNGGGAYGGTLRSCGLAFNSATFGGATYQVVATNCTLTANTGLSYGGGAYGGTLYNCILFYNTAPLSPNQLATLHYCCTTPLPDFGPDNLATEPRLVSAFRLTADSPCRGAGSAMYARGTDLDNEAWLAPPAMGCDEFYSGTGTGPLTVAIVAAYTNVAPGTTLRFLADIRGAASSNCWTFGDGTSATNRFEALGAWSTTGDYPVVLTAYNASNPGGVSATQVVHVISRPVAYVSKTSATPVAPYRSWATAATNIQDAVDASTVPGALVVVSNGVYASGGTRTVGGMSTNRVTVGRSLTLQSVNGPAVTVIEGRREPGATNGPAAIRCVFLGADCRLVGFTLTNGATRNSDDPVLDRSGGGVWCAPSATVSNCVLVGNSGHNSGGGVYSGVVLDSVLSGNSAGTGGAAHSASLMNCRLTDNVAANSGGGAAASTLAGCLLDHNASVDGGGAYNSMLNLCTVSNNAASYPSGFPFGGGTSSCQLTNCLLVANVSGGPGGGAGGGILDHCTVTNNYAADSGGGVYGAAVTQCTLTANKAGTFGGGLYSGTATHSTLAANQANNGGGAHSGTLTNCVLSQNTAANGGGAFNGNLFNCTLAGNSALNLGGGASSATLNNCMVTDNSAATGGGVDASTVNNSLLARNTASVSGGGAHNSTLNNATLVANTAAAYGGGALNGNLNNSIAFYNFAAIGSNYNSSTLTYSCSAPLATGLGNICLDPQLAGYFRLTSASPCRGAGTGLYATATDLDGESWLNPPSMGCDEFYAGTATGPLTVAIDAPYTNLVAGSSASFSAIIGGNATAITWEVNGVQTSNRPSIAGNWALPGDYPVVLRAHNGSNPGGVSATVMVRVVAQQVYYVALNSPAPAAPYRSWATAATNIQAAIDVADVAGATVLVSNGVYQVGGRKMFGGLTNRVAVTKPLCVRSVNGPVVTSIRGYQVPGTTNGAAAVRGVYLTNGAAISGFTIADGATTSAGDPVLEQSGGGLWCASAQVTISNCVLSANKAVRYGGGSWLGSFRDCTLAGNTAGYGGGVYGGRLQNSLVSGNVGGEGGGVHSCSLSNSTVAGNSAPYQNPTFIGNGGGGAYCQMENCVIAGNSADMAAAGLLYGALNNCSVLSNHLDISGFLPQAGGTYSVDMTNCLVAWNASAGQGGGVDRGFIKNCLIANNLATAGGGGAIVATLANCVIVSNSAPYGGAAWGCDLVNCTVVGNCATNFGAGLITSRATNSILYYNVLYGGSSTETNYDSLCTLAYSCATPPPTNGVGNFADDPALVSLAQGDFRLQPFSACINSGNNAFAPTGSDRDGNPRIAGGTVDVGAYERQAPASMLSYAWAQHYGFPTDGSADAADPDHDGLTVWQEWVAGTDPTNALSVLKLFSPSNSPSGVALTWQSVNTRTYFLQRSTNLSSQPAFSTLQSNITGLTGTTSITDTTATNTASFFYRVGVHH